MLRSFFFAIMLLLFQGRSISQCGTAINSFPYLETFEGSDGAWTPGGFGSDWEWGTPAKPVINAAAEGLRCWIAGGLSGNAYTNGEASWLQSPCFDFSALQYPMIDFRVFWETEQQFDGASFQYSLDNGASWTTVGAANDPVNCLNTNWYNQSPVTYLSPLTTNRQGWSGNRQNSSGSCRGGNGSGGWVNARHTMPYLAGEPAVLFRFIFGAGTICNDYAGFAVDSIAILEAPPNAADFTYECAGNNLVNFTNTSALCPTGYSWDFGDPASGANNTSALKDPSHVFSAPGTYTISLTATGPGNAPSTITREVTIIRATVSMLTMVDCETNTGGSLIVAVEGTNNLVNLAWSTNPVQTTPVISNLQEGIYTVTISGADICTLTVTGKAEKDISCIGVFFPSGFTPNGDGKNDGFGAIGSLSSISQYRLEVFNRWGERVFYTTDPYQQWDGRVKGRATDGNLFVWQAQYKLPGQDPLIHSKGTIVLIR